MANLAIIPARGGSKRIPRKNIKEFFGKPIIAYSIEAALKSNLFDDVIVSTDDNEIADIAKKYGAKVPFLRSDNNANDFATLSDVLLEVLLEYKKIEKLYENICCILPTAALLTSCKLEESYNEFINKKMNSFVPVIRFSYPIQRALKSQNGLLKMNEEKYLNHRSQDLEPLFHDSGQFYWLNTANFLLEQQIFTNKTGYLEIKEYEAQDVDTLEDWTMLELKYNLKK